MLLDELDECDVDDPATFDPLDIEPGELPEDEEDLGRFQRAARRDRRSE